MSKDLGAIPGSSSLRSPEPVPVSAHSGDDPARKSVGYHSPSDDEETTAFIDGWNAALDGEDDFDLALHFWNRRRCGI